MSRPEALLERLAAGDRSVVGAVTGAYADLAGSHPDRAADLLDGVAAIAAGGNETARGVLIDIVIAQRLAARTVRQILLDNADVEDAVQNTLIAVAERVDRFEGRSRFTTWLHTVARNEALMVLRRRQRPTNDTVELEPEQPQFVRRLSSVVIDRASVQAALQELPDLQREVIELREIEGLDYQTIADRLGIPVGTVRSRVNRARQMLAERLLGSTQ